MKNLGKKKLTDIIRRLQDAKRHSTLETMHVNNICALAKSPACFEDGKPVTEARVSDFIRERVRLHHASWITGPLEEIIQELCDIRNGDES